MKKLIYFFPLILSLFLVTSFIPKFKPSFAVKTVVIDAGHGGKDPGTHGKKHKEKDIALAVALKLGQYIEENIKDVKVVYTRKTDVFIELQERANIANKAKADLFICIHCNAACFRDKKTKKDICKDFVHGAETYVMGIKNEQGKLDVAKRENSAILLEDDYVQKYDGFDPNSDESYIIMSMFTDTYLNQSLNFASKLQNQYATKAGRQDKGVKRASLWVLWRTYMPSVLTEIGFLTNPEEENFLGSTKGQEYIASCIFRAFRSYKDEIDGTIKKYDDHFEKQEALKPIVDSVGEDELEEMIDSSENVVSEKPKEVVVEKPKEKPVEEKPKEVIVEKLKEKPVEEKPKEVVVEKPKEKLVEEKPKEVVVEKPKEVIVEKPKEKPVEEKAKEKTVEEKPKEVVVEKPKEKPMEEKPIPSVIVYKVQIMMSEKKIELNSDKFKSLEKPNFYMDKGIYKYTVGEFDNLKDAVKMQAELREKGFKDAFVIKMQDGKRILSK